MEMYVHTGWSMGFILEWNQMTLKRKFERILLIPYKVEDPHTEAWCMQRSLVEMGGETAVWQDVPDDD
jgi:hypothetical protein